MSGNDLVSYTREFIHETVSDFWTAPRLLASMNASMKRIVLKMQKMADRVFYTSCPIPVVAGTQRYALPDGVLYIAAPKCTGKIDHVFNSAGDQFGKADFRLIHKSETGTPANIVVVGNWIYLDRIPVASETLTLWYWYFPADIAATATAIDFLEGYEEWIALETAKKSLIKDEAALEDIRFEIAEMQQEFVNTYCGSRHQGEPDEISEDVLDPD
jgi:hypothetical protein